MNSKPNFSMFQSENFISLYVSFQFNHGVQMPTLFRTTSTCTWVYSFDLSKVTNLVISIELYNIFPFFIHSYKYNPEGS